MLLLTTLAFGATVATYGLDATDGTAVWDATGVAHGCLVGNAMRTSGVVGGAVDLNGGFVELPVVAVEPFTLAAYVRGDGDGVVLSMGELTLEVVDGGWEMGGIRVADPAPSPGVWQHVAVSVDEGLASLWVGQVEVGTTLVTGTLGEVVWGAAVDGSSAWRGSIDELALLDGPATSDDLRVLTTGFGGPTDGADCGDYDLDGLDDVVELALGTDPALFDTDADTFDDLTEVGDPSNPVDTDNDGLIDALDDDDDNDGISSVKERISDADGDGSPDLDADGDGIENAKDDDSDGDGIPDAVEGIEDSDGDGILDFLDAVDDSVVGGVDTAGEAAAGTEPPKEGCGCVTGAAGSSWSWLLRRR